MSTKSSVLPYEELQQVDKLSPVIAAESSLHGWEYKGYPPVVLTAVPWALRKEEERSWNLHLHCWDMLDSLLRAHSGTGDERYLGPAVLLATEWISKHGSQSAPGISPWAWDSFAVAMRSYRLAYIIDAGEARGAVKEQERPVMWQALEKHQTFLADDANIALHSHHGFYQAAGQLAMGRRFAGRSPAMAKAHKQGAERLWTALETQFTPDGMHRDHSPEYHRQAYEALRAVLDAGLTNDPKIIAFAEKIEKALSWLVLPNGHIVNFGDSDYRSMASKGADVSRRWRTPQMQYAVSNGSAGAISFDDNMAFSEGGYFVARKPSERSPGDFSQSSYLAQIAAFHSRTHKHADDLSFVWSDRGLDLLVDAGRYGYVGKVEQGSDLWRDGFRFSDPRRVYCETTRAHNALEFDNQDYKRKGAKPYGSALKRWSRAESGVIAVETECKHFGGVRHARVLLFQPRQWLLVFDWFNDNNGETHTAKQWFHLAPSLELLMDKVGPLVSMASGQEPLRIVPLLDGTTVSRPYVGQESPSIQGWWSPKEKKIVPACAFYFEQTGVSTGCFATLFTFSSSLTPDRAWSTVNVSGRRAQLRWKDETARHVLYLERPTEGELSVNYTPTPSGLKVGAGVPSPKDGTFRKAPPGFSNE